MAEYIEREAAMKELMNDAPEQVGYSRQDAADCIRYMDSADVAPVKHGQWIFKQDKEFPCFGKAICSECRNVISISPDLLDVDYQRVFAGQKHYCYNCGADMRESKEE